MAVDAWNDEKSDELDRLRTLMAWNANVQPNFSKTRRKAIKPMDVFRLPTDPVPKGVNLAEIKKQFARDQELLKNKGKEINPEQFK